MKIQKKQNREKDEFLFSRRHFFKAGIFGTGGLALSSLSSGIKAEGFENIVSSEVASVFRKLHAPMAPITVPYDNNYMVDYNALQKWTEFVCEGKPPVLFFTLGDGEVDVLSEEEIGKINLTVAKHAKGKALVVGATGQWWTGRMVDFVKRMEDGGLDAINLHFNHRIDSVDQLYPAIEKIASSTKIPLILYDDTKMTTSTIDKLSVIPQVVGVKSHADLYQFYAQVKQAQGKRFAVLGAGQMKQFYFGGQFGSPGYLCLLAPIAPEISWKFYDAVTEGRMEDAQQYIFDYEDQLLAPTIPLGYPQAYKSMLYLAGYYNTNLVRLPRITPPVSKLEELKVIMKDKGLI